MNKSKKILLWSWQCGQKSTWKRQMHPGWARSLLTLQTSSQVAFLSTPPLCLDWFPWSGFRCPRAASFAGWAHRTSSRTRKSKNSHDMCNVGCRNRFVCDRTLRGQHATWSSTGDTTHWGLHWNWDCNRIQVIIYIAWHPGNVNCMWPVLTVKRVPLLTLVTPASSNPGAWISLWTTKFSYKQRIRHQESRLCLLSQTKSVDW